MKNTVTGLFQVYKNNLSSILCEQIIERFESWDKDDRTYPGVTVSGLDRNIKDTQDLPISGFSEWKDIDMELHKALQGPIASYLSDILNDFAVLDVKDTEDTGYQIKRTTPKQRGYARHNDSHYLIPQGRYRIITFLWYLNTIKEGGETEFIDRGVVEPEAGKLILFPACWTFPHIGHPPKTENKYIATGWVYSTY